MECLRLLAEARTAGLTVTVEEDRLVVRGPRRAECVARALLRHKAEIVELLRQPSVAPASLPWSAISAHRRRAESVEELREVWQASVDEIALRWECAGSRDDLWLPEADDHGLQDEIGDAIRSGDRSRALLGIEAWRDAWLGVLGQPDLESSGRLNVIDGSRYGSQRLPPLPTNQGSTHE